MQLYRDSKQREQRLAAPSLPQHSHTNIAQFLLLKMTFCWSVVIRSSFLYNMAYFSNWVRGLSRSIGVAAAQHEAPGTLPSVHDRP